MKKFDSFIPSKIQIKYAKYILGVDKSATNLTVMSELGLFPLAISAIRGILLGMKESNFDSIKLFSLTSKGRPHISLQ
jgi:hypothetical protein